MRIFAASNSRLKRSSHQSRPGPVFGSGLEVSRSALPGKYEPKRSYSRAEDTSVFSSCPDNRTVLIPNGQAYSAIREHDETPSDPATHHLFTSPHLGRTQRSIEEASSPSYTVAPVSTALHPAAVVSCHPSRPGPVFGNGLEVFRSLHLGKYDQISNGPFPLVPSA